MGPDGIYPGVLRELEEVLTKTFFIICQQSCLTKEVPGDRKFTNVISIYKSWAEDPGNYSPVSLTFGSREGHRAANFEHHHTTHAGHPGDQDHKLKVSL